MNQQPLHTEQPNEAVADLAPAETTQSVDPKPKKRKRSKPRRKKAPSISILSLVLAGVLGLLAGFLACVLFLFIGNRSQLPMYYGDSSTDPEGKGYSYGGDVETNEESNEAYSLPSYKGDSSGVTIQLDAPKQALTPTELYAQQLPTAVSITAYAGNSAAFGSGMVLTEDGFLLTCAHVVVDTESATVTTYDDKEYDAELVGLDEDTDLALLKIDAHDLTPVTFADSEQLVIGETAYALGDSLGPQFRSSFTNGIISGLHREVSNGSKTMTLLQTTAAVNGGNSGGALYNGAGQVIGVVNMKKSSQPFGVSVDNMGLAVPSATVKTIVETLAKERKVSRAVLGISCMTLDEASAHVFGVPVGLYVSEISPASQCDEGGMLIGDIIVALNGTPIETVYDIKEKITNCKAGDSITVTVWRDPDISAELNKPDADQDSDSADASTSNAPADSSASEEIEYHYELFGDLTVQLISSEDVNN